MKASWFTFFSTCCRLHGLSLTKKSSPLHPKFSFQNSLERERDL